MSEKIIVCPGETIKELLNVYNYTQKDLADKLEIELKTMNEIINGKGVITFETAVKLGIIFDMNPSFWNNLEFNYRKELNDIKEEENINVEYEKIKIAYKELVKRGKVQDVKDKRAKVLIYKSFMEVVNIDQITDDYLEIACRRTEIKRFSPINLMTWIQCGIKKARNIEVKDFDKDKILEIIPKIKRLTLYENQKEATEELQNLCGLYGIIVSYEKTFPNTAINGIAKWLTPNKAFIQVSDKEKKADTFWFTFMHELGHIVKGKKKEIFIDLDDYKEDEREKLANSFAENMLITNLKKYEKLKNNITQNAVEEFAKESEIATGIVAGRLQHDKKLYTNKMLTSLRRKLDFEAEKIY